MQRLKYKEKDFDWVKITTKQIEKVGSDLIEHKKKVYKEIKNILPEKRTFENTVYTIECSEGIYGDMMREIGLLQEVSPKEEIRNTAFSVINDVSKKLVDIEYDRDIYIALCEYYEGNFEDEKKNLGKDSIKLLEDTILEYRRMGFDLEENKRRKLKDLIKKSSKLANSFGKNINDYNDYILCSREDLDGVPERVINSLRKDNKGKYIVSLQYPEYIPFMMYANNRKLREELANKNLKKGGKKNLKILNDLIKIRHEKAYILGYKHHADFRLETRMAKNAKMVDDFQGELLNKLLKGSKNDLDEVKSFAKKIGINNLEHFDFAFVSNKLKESLYNYNSEEVREYFPLEHVLLQMFSLTEKLFDVKINKLNYKLWHKDVTLYELKEKNKKNEVVGYFAMDLFPRIGKFGHAMCSDVLIGRMFDLKSDLYVTPFSTIVCNFPTPNKNTPSVLSLSDVETLFHEFGHCLHMLFTKVRHESQSGASVTWDFVETPSQIMENFVWDDLMLSKLSKNFKTGKSLSKELREKILKAKKFQSAYFYTRQIIQGMLDMDLHTKRANDGAKRYIDLVKKYSGINLPKESLFPAGFGHLGGGYDAGYYSYLWALVYACDAFSEFKKGGIISNKIGMMWRHEVLERGSSEKEEILIKNFLGRKPNNKAFLKETGIE